MKKLIYGLVFLTTMLCLIGCKPEPADSTGSDSSSPTSDPGEPAKEPTVDTTTLDGWYVGTFNCAGQKLNYDTFKIDGNKMSYYWFEFSVSNGEVSLDLQEDLDCEIAVDGLKFNDYVDEGNPIGDNWEMYTDSKGTWLRDLDTPNMYEPMQKVLGPDKFGIENGTMNFYLQGDNYCIVTPFYYRYLIIYKTDAGYMSVLPATKNGNVYEPEDKDFDLKITITTSGCTVEYVNDSYDYLPTGNYSLYTRNSPWPATVKAE